VTAGLVGAENCVVGCPFVLFGAQGRDFSNYTKYGDLCGSIGFFYFQMIESNY
jgi:hypothetical protein